MKYKVGDKVIVNPERSKRPGVFTITSISVGSPTSYKLSDSNGKPAGEWFAESIIKVPLFKIGQIVQIKDIKNDKWFVNTMSNLDGESGIITEVSEKLCNENYYQSTKAGEDGCRYRVKILRTCDEWSISSTSLQFVPTITTIEDVRNISQDDSGPQGDLGVVANDSALDIAQAVDNIKPRFKIGDTVVIRNDLIPGKEYNEWDYSPEDGLGGWLFLPEMAEYKGKVATVTGFGDMEDVNYLRLDIDGGQYSWIINAVSHYTPGSDYDLDKQIINQLTNNNRYENQLQGKEEPLIGGCECTGTGVCYPGEQAATCIGHLGYRKITYRS